LLRSRAEGLLDEECPRIGSARRPSTPQLAFPELWIVNLRSDRVEVHRVPDAASARYREVTSAYAGEGLVLTTLPAVRVAVDDLLPAR
jgi:hypothetical protein